METIILDILKSDCDVQVKVGLIEPLLDNQEIIDCLNDIVNDCVAERVIHELQLAAINESDIWYAINVDILDIAKFELTSEQRYTIDNEFDYCGVYELFIEWFMALPLQQKIKLINVCM